MVVVTQAKVYTVEINSKKHRSHTTYAFGWLIFLAGWLKACTREHESFFSVFFFSHHFVDSMCLQAPFNKIFLT